MDKLAEIKKKIEEIQAKSAVSNEMRAFIELVLNVIKKSKDELTKLSEENIQVIRESIAYIEKNHENTLGVIKEEKDAMVGEFNANLTSLKQLIEEVKAIEVKDGEDGEDGEDADPEEIIPLVLERLPKPFEETGETIANKLEALKGDERLDASAIKNLPVFNGSKLGGVVARNIYQLGDVSLSSLTNGQALVWDDTNKIWKNDTVSGSGTIDGSGTTNEIPYWVDSNTLGSLATATYPSLTELSYVKGVTSGIQSQLNGKAPSLGADDNYVTDAEKIKLSNISITQAVDLDTLESDTATNNAKVTNATHTGEVTGATTLTVDKTAITGKSAVTAVGTDYILISDTSDSGNLKKALASDLTGSGGATWGSITGTLSSQTDLQTELLSLQALAISL